MDMFNWQANLHKPVQYLHNKPKWKNKIIEIPKTFYLQRPEDNALKSTYCAYPPDFLETKFLSVRWFFHINLLKKRIVICLKSVINTRILISDIFLKSQKKVVGLHKLSNENFEKFFRPTSITIIHYYV